MPNRAATLSIEKYKFSANAYFKNIFKIGVGLVLDGERNRLSLFEHIISVNFIKKYYFIIITRTIKRYGLLKISTKIWYQNFLVT